jgi:deoxycytidylate deaminase
MNLSLDVTSLLAEDGECLHTSPSFGSAIALSIRSTRQHGCAFQGTSLPSRDREFLFSGPRWLRTLERDRMFNKAVFDLLEWYRRDSTCPEEKVAAAIYGYADGMVDLLSIGINGSPIDCLAPQLYIHKRSCEHAEDRALKQLFANSRLYHLICYTSLAPCLGCAEKLFRAGVEAVPYVREYRDRAGKEFLLNKSIPVYKLSATGQMFSLNPDLCLLQSRPYPKMNRVGVCM